MSEEERGVCVSMVRAALSASQDAVRLDTDDNLAEAEPFYRRTIALLSGVAPLLPARARERSARLIALYEARLAQTVVDPGRVQQEEGVAAAMAPTFEHEAWLTPAAAAERLERAPPEPLRRPFWVLRLLRASFYRGGFLSPSLYVSAAVWQQDAARLSGFAHKRSALRRTLAALDALRNDAAALGAGRAALLRALLAFAAVTRALHEELSRVFTLAPAPAPAPPAGAAASAALPAAHASPRASKPATPAAAAPVKARARGMSGGGGGSGSGGGGGGTFGAFAGELSSVAASLGRRVAQGALAAQTAVERAGAALPTAVGGADLAQYGQLVAGVAAAAEFLDGWAQLVVGQGGGGGVAGGTTTRSTGTGSAGGQGHGQEDALQRAGALLLIGGAGGAGGEQTESAAQAQAARAALSDASAFLGAVLCPLLLRDVDALCRCHLQAARKAFTRPPVAHAAR
eukprot:g4526.t1